ncbi:ATP-binding protein [Saccharomonospora iraqiensis]|uniref:ATP-binding protein n=1 Tax=Saccharomonospora iraqiensis TaxID=52698 RepID=UPI000424AB7C|nr:ATP-binding protein [Saccharomonospora iraqiensis]
MSGEALAVHAPVHVHQARMAAGRAAREAGLAERTVERVVLAVSELATNLQKYATGGLLMAIPRPDGLDVVATDLGPGIADVPDSMRDGHSTTGTLGVGLGGVRRMADVVDIHSRPGEGTTVLARWTVAKPPHLGVEVGAALAAAAGETECGDNWVVAHERGVTTVALSDGLGHGPEAASASAAVTAHVAANPSAPPGQLIAAMDADSSVRRGATAAVAQFHPARSTLTFSAVGNSVARLFPGDGTHEALVSTPGIVGRRQRSGGRAAPVVRPWSGRSRLVMHTDGVTQRWRAEEIAELLAHDPATAAGWLLGRYGRHRDDSCVVVVGGGEVG